MNSAGNQNFPGGSAVKNPPAMQEIQVRSLGWRDLEEEMATHTCILACEILWTEEAGGLLRMGSQRLGYDWATQQQQQESAHRRTWEINCAGLPIQPNKWGKERVRSGFEYRQGNAWQNDPSSNGGHLSLPGSFPGGTSGKEPTCQCRRLKRPGFDPWVGKIPWRRAWQLTPIFMPGESHGQRSLRGYGL